MISKILAPLLLVAALNAATYNENYRVTDLNETIKPNYNVFMQGDFEKIIRYDMINMEDGENSSAVVDAASKKVKELQDAGKSVKVSIIGYTSRATDDMNEYIIDSDTYANTIQNWFRSDLDTKEAMQTSKDYAKEIKDKMLDENLSEDTLFTEWRGGLDQGFSEGTSDGRDLSNRVMVAIYVSEPIPKDSDGDGVIDKNDECPNTPKNVSVNAKGCPLDMDSDGVYDYEDKCPETPLGLNVDPNGCPLSSKLHLNFKTSSDKILKDSYPEIQNFATFMKENPMYKAEIVGHTDSSGNAVKNMDLSKRRAVSVEKALENDGVEASRLTSSGRGVLDPVASNETSEGRSQNRRIEVKLSY